MLRLLSRLLFFSLTLSLLGAVVYSFTESFTQQWRRFVIEEFRQRGVYLDFQRLGLGIADGVVAQEVRMFSDAAHRTLIVSMDRLNLDLDYGRLMEKKFFVEALELMEASVSLPLDPGDPKQGELNLKNFNARLFLMDDRLDIRQAEGDLEGVHVVMTGSLMMPSNPVTTAKKAQPTPTAPSQATMPNMDFMRERRSDIQAGLRWLNRFTFQHRPRMTLDVHGNLDRPEKLTAELTFAARGVVHEGYVCQELSAVAEYRDGLLDVRRLMLRDAVGTFEGNASWPVGGDEVNFRLTTSSNLPQLAQSFFQSNELREVVFYESSPPNLTLEGTWFVKGPKATPRRPVQALGALKFGRFTTRGEVFDGLTASFGVSPDGYYIRDALLRHKTGTVSLQAMSRDVEGFRYRAVVKMDPHAFLAFIPMEKTRELINKFELTEASTLFLQVEGQGTGPSPASCRTVGRLELHDFKFSGVEFKSWTGNLELFNKKQIFRDVTMIPREGIVRADEVIMDDEVKTVYLTGVRGTADPVPLTSCFARKTAEVLVKYRFGPNTNIELDGSITFVRDQGSADLRVKFSAPEGTATYPLWKRDYVIQAPVGLFTFKGSRMTYDVKGLLFSGPLSAKGEVELKPPGGYSVNLQASDFRQVILGKDLSFTNLSATAGTEGEGSPFQIRANVLGGTVTLKGAYAVDQPEDYRGELSMTAMSFERFASVYAPGNESEGDITGHFTFTGKLSDWKALKGAGVMIILNGNLYALPVLGPLTPLIGALLPGNIKNYNVAREANCNFQVADGFVVTQDFEALTGAFRLVAQGNIDFIKDDIDFTAQARMRGLPGLVLRPVSELLEFRGEGPMGKPRWRSNYFSLGKGKKGEERKPPTEAELDAARQEASKINKDKPKPRPIFPLMRQGR